MSGKLRVVCVSIATSAQLLWAPAASSQSRDVYFGDLHLHTSWSADASLGGNMTGDPDFAYRYARGYPVVHPKHGARVRIDRPLDFLAVSDHAEFMGVIPMILAGDPRVSGSDIAKRFISLFAEGRSQEASGILINQVWSGDVDPALSSEEVSGSVWARIASAAERYNDPGTFTSLIAWEWSAMPGRSNLHRVVLLRDGSEMAGQFLPFSSLESNEPEDLWAWLEETSERTGAQFIAIPHNSNLSLGKMFELRKRDGTPIDAAYSKRRMHWEPIVEVTQVKGDSETHPSISPTDEFASYETFVDLNGDSPDREGDFVRSGLRRGLEIFAKSGSNPYTFGLIGSTDAHTGIASVEEDNFHGKYPNPSTPAANLAPSQGGSIRGLDLGAAGLAAIWAEENTREAIFDALRRKETYATTGPRIRLRFFGGYTYEESDLTAQDSAKQGYAKGVAMGGTLPAKSGSGARAPRFMIQAGKDPAGANLDRIQVVKGWVDAGGSSHEMVYDVALSDDRRLGPSGNAPPVGTTVDLSTGIYTNSIGDPVLQTVWTDPDFEPGQPAFYYARVLEIPTPRHSLLDAIAIGVPHPEERPATIQERAYSSPIYYEP